MIMSLVSKQKTAYEMLRSLVGKQKTAYEMLRSLVGSEMCIRDRSDFHPVIRPFSPLRLGRSYRLAPKPDGSPLFALLPLVACWRYEPRERLRPLALSRPAVPPSPLSDRVGYSDHVRFRGYVPVHCRSGLQPPCLRFATAVTGRHARLGSRLLARLCRGRHRRRQTSTRLQGATLIKPDRQICRVARPLLAFAPTEPTV